MRQKTLLSKLMLLLCALIVGSSSLWAETVYYTLTPANGSNNSYTGNCDIAINGITWNLAGNSQQIPWRIGGKSLSGVDRTVYSKTAMESPISKVELTVGNASSITVNSLKLIVASDANFSDQLDEVSKTFAANSTITFEPTSGTEWATGAYYKFVFNVSVSGTSNKFVEFKEAKFYKEGSSAPVQLSAPELTATANNGSVTLEWEAINHASSYTIQYADNVEFTGATTVANATSPKEISGLTNGTTYYFKAMTVGDGTNYTSSDYGDAVSATPANVSKITITQDNLTDFTNTYGWYDWTVGNVSGKAYAYKNSGMQFNSGKDAYWIYNTTAIPGNITSVRMVKASSATDRDWILKVGTSEITTTGGGTQIGNAQTVGTSGATWDVSGSYNYFLLYVSGGSTVISSIEITYVPSTDPIIGASDPAELAYNAAGGEFGYSITNPTSATLSATSNSGWITNVVVDGTNSKVTFSTSTNPNTTQRTGTITLSYTDATDKVITITQAGAPAPSISADDVNIAYNATSGEITFTLDNPANGSLSVSEEVAWISSATLNTQENKVTFSCETNEGVVARTGTVTITYTYNTNQTVSKEVTVTQGVDETLGTAANPYTVAQARAYIDGLNGSTSADGKHVSGIISQVDSYNSNYSSITYWISDDGTTTNQLEVYSGKGIDGEDFSAVTDVAVGAEVVVKGKLKYFSSQSVYEFDYNNELVSYTAPSVNTPSITAENVNITSDATGGSIAFIVKNEVTGGSISASTQDSWITLGNETTSPISFTCVSNTGVARTATVTLTYTYNTNETVTKDVTITQAAYVAPLPTPTSDNYIRISNLSQLTDGSIVVIAARYDNDNATNYYAMANTTSGKPTGTLFTSDTSNGLEILPSDIVNNENDHYWVVNVATENNSITYTFTNPNGDKIAYGSSGTDFVANGTKTNWTIESSKSGGNAMVVGYTGFVIRNKVTETRGVGFNGTTFGAYATSNMNASGYNFYLDFFVQKATGTITLNSACNDNGVIYGTFYTDHAYVMPENLDGSVVKVDNEGKLVVQTVYEGTNGDVVPANTALLINSYDTFTGTKDYTIFYTNESGVDHSSDNMLKGTLTADETTVGDNCLFYRLTMHGANPSNNEPGTIGFWWGASDGGAFKPGANKAYLAVPALQAARISGFAFDEDGTTTAIEDVRVADGKNAVYNLNGQRVNNPAKGMYIVNGKKVIK